MVLTLLGLGVNADAVYQAMLSDTKADVAQVAKQLGWPEVRVRAGLDELARLSLVRPSSEVPGEFRPVPPRVGLSPLLSRQEAELRRREVQLAEGKAALERLVEEHAELDLQRYAGVEQLVGSDSIRSRTESLVCESRSEIMAFVPDGPLSEESMRAGKPLELAALGRGVRMRTVYQDSMLSDITSASYTGRLAERGAQIRTAPVLPPRMTIFDRSMAILPMDPQDGGAGAVLVRGTGMLTALCELFGLVWESARPLGQGRVVGDDGLVEQERVVLRLLAQGYTDEAVARKLAVSVRTGRRVTAGLSARLGAKSRFQAGAHAVLRGWLVPDDLDADATQ